MEAIDAVVVEIMRLHRSLPPRLSIEEVEAAKTLIRNIESEHQQKLEHQEVEAAQCTGTANGYLSRQRSYMKYLLRVQPPPLPFFPFPFLLFSPHFPNVAVATCCRLITSTPSCRHPANAQRLAQSRPCCPRFEAVVMRSHTPAIRPPLRPSVYRPPLSPSVRRPPLPPTAPPRSHAVAPSHIEFDSTRPSPSRRVVGHCEVDFIEAHIRYGGMGTILVIKCANTIHYHSQSSSYALALNNFAVSGDSNLEMPRSNFDVELDAALATWLTNDVAMLSTKNGELLLLTIYFDGRTKLSDHIDLKETPRGAEALCISVGDDGKACIRPATTHSG
ncbi:hypothetical protein Drorol1_Dr00018247 [Drosera rotundifolia]